LISYQWISAFIALAIAIKIVFLVRRDVLHARYAFWWFTVAALVIIAGVFPKLIDALLIKLGVHYPPIVVVAVGVGLMLIKILTIDLEQSRQERKIRRLTQRLAMYEADYEPVQEVRNGNPSNASSPGRKN
jgi:hypothetical protein